SSLYGGYLSRGCARVLSIFLAAEWVASGQPTSSVSIGGFRQRRWLPPMRQGPLTGATALVAPIKSDLGAQNIAVLGERTLLGVHPFPKRWPYFRVSGVLAEEAGQVLARTRAAKPSDPSHTKLIVDCVRSSEVGRGRPSPRPRPTAVSTLP